MSSPRDTRVCRQETVIAVFQCASVPSSWLLSPPPHALAAWLGRSFLCVLEGWSLAHVRRPGGSMGPPASGGMALCPFACACRVCVPDTGLLFCQSGDPQPIHATHFLARGETLLTHVFLCARCVVWMFLITACLGWREASGPAVVSAEGHYPRLRLG